jgi:hypothetical protein
LGKIPPPPPPPSPSTEVKSLDSKNEDNTEQRFRVPESLREPDTLLLAALMCAEAHLADVQTSTIAWENWMKMFNPISLTLGDGVGGGGGDSCLYTRTNISRMKRDALELLGYDTQIGREEYRIWMMALCQAMPGWMRKVFL